jgi:DNA polymerase (family 10)
MDNKQIAAVLEQMGVLLTLKGANPFKVRAFENGARTVESLTEPLSAIVERGEKLTAIKGIGKGLAAEITALLETGESPDHQRLLDETPPGLLQMLDIPGLGPKKVLKIHTALQIDTLDALEEACTDGTVADLKGLGKKTAENILKGIDFLKKSSGRRSLGGAKDAADAMLEDIRAVKEVQRAEIAGSLRRWRETVKDIDIVVSVKDMKHAPKVMSALIHHELTDDITNQGDTKSSIRTTDGLQIDLRVVPDDTFPCTLHHFTGSKEHNVAMRSLAQKAGYKISEWGVFKGDSEAPLKIKDENAFFKTFNMDFVPPELRENRGEIEAAQSGDLPNLITQDDIRGCLHMHTVASDGTAQLEDYAMIAVERGWEYMGISDHSQAAAYAGGLSAKRLREQMKEIDKLNKKYKGDVQLLKGIEADILTDGTVDLEEVLPELDFVVASLHSNFTLDREKMTARVIRAIENPHVDIIGHLTARLVLRREPVQLDIEAVLDAAAANETTMECNAHPKRLDLNDLQLRMAVERDCWIAINQDAHSLEGLDLMPFGIGTARRGWVPRDFVINTFTLDEILEHFAD